jgi:hypothetical protein
MKESYDEGVASHIDPESCAEDCKGLSEALTGTCGQSIEPLNPIKVQGADVVGRSGRQQWTHR